jgi:hypothetical protein
VNAPTIGAEAHLPFGGVKATGNGHREGGWEVYDFYSETKVCYVDYSGPCTAQIDTTDHHRPLAAAGARDSSRAIAARLGVERCVHAGRFWEARSSRRGIAGPGLRGSAVPPIPQEEEVLSHSASAGEVRRSTSWSAPPLPFRWPRSTRTRV